MGGWQEVTVVCELCNLVVARRSNKANGGAVEEASGNKILNATRSDALQIDVCQETHGTGASEASAALNCVVLFLCLWPGTAFGANSA